MEYVRALIMIDARSILCDRPVTNLPLYVLPLIVRAPFRTHIRV
jgi:hypothetical protein